MMAITGDAGRREAEKRRPRWREQAKQEGETRKSDDHDGSANN